MTTRTVTIAACALLAACADTGYKGPTAAYRSPTPAEVHEAVRVAKEQTAADMARNGYDPVQAAAEAEHYQRTDAECRYEATAGAAHTWGALLYSAHYGNLYQLCMQARI